MGIVSQNIWRAKCFPLLLCTVQIVQKHHGHHGILKVYSQNLSVFSAFCHISSKTAIKMSEVMFTKQNETSGFLPGIAGMPEEHCRHHKNNQETSRTMKVMLTVYNA